MRTRIVFLMCVALVAARAKEAFNTTPPPIRTRFLCAGRAMGFYADLETNCRAYHMCDDHGNHFTHYCPEDTAFRQDAMICDHAYLVDCKAGVEKGSSIKLSQDANHDAPPSSFVEPRGEGSQARGFARSFRINPDTKNDTAKFPTFVLNSSVFLTSRETTSSRPTTRFREPDTQRTIVTQSGKGFESSTNFRTSENLSRNSIITTPRTTIAKELQPPAETSRAPKIVNEEYQDDEYSFLIPPPIRDDNFLHQQHQNNFESLKNNDNSQKSSQSTFRIVAVDNFRPTDTTTSSPFTSTTTTKARASSFVAKPLNFLEPPHLKPDFPAIARSNFSFRKSTTAGLSTSASSSFATSQTTQATIFPVPNKTLLPGGDTELDPYYPKSSSTEVYYTPRHDAQSLTTTTTKRPFGNNARIQIPAQLPDLNSLEDLLDRRKFFFIPQAKSS